MVDASLLLLSLANQLDQAGRQVTIEFIDGEPGTMGYLDRLGFFDRLSSTISVLPSRPAYSGALLYAQNNAYLVEIARISRLSPPDQLLPHRLVQALLNGRGAQEDSAALQSAAQLMFSELIGNILEHSETALDGFAVLQLYEGGKSKKVQVAVSDSGLGIMKTLRPVLAREYPQLANLSDIEVIVEAFRAGVSRHGPSRGNGLAGCARKAIDFKAQLNVRLARQSIRLVPAEGQFQPHKALCRDGIPEISGTHIAFTF
jgi:hypothetical protein